jgi:hypothetical protein
MDMTTQPAPTRASFRAAGVLGAGLVAVSALQSYESSRYKDETAAQLAAIQQARAVATPRCAGKRVQVYTGLTPCQSQTLTAQIEAERQALSGMLAQNRTTQQTR